MQIGEPLCRLETEVTVISTEKSACRRLLPADCGSLTGDTETIPSQKSSSVRSPLISHKPVSGPRATSPG
jgi:hypothetical protein